MVQGEWYHQEVPSWPQHLLTHSQVSQFSYHTGLHAERQTGCTRASSWTPYESFHFLHHEEPKSRGVWLPSQPPGRSPVPPARGPPSPSTDFSFGQWSLQEHPHSGVWIPCTDYEVCRAEDSDVDRMGPCSSQLSVLGSYVSSPSTHWESCLELQKKWLQEQRW